MYNSEKTLFFKNQLSMKNWFLEFSIYSFISCLKTNWTFLISSLGLGLKKGKRLLSLLRLGILFQIAKNPSPLIEELNRNLVISSLFRKSFYTKMFFYFFFNEGRKKLPLFGKDWKRSSVDIRHAANIFLDELIHFEWRSSMMIFFSLKNSGRIIERILYNIRTDFTHMGATRIKLVNWRGEQKKKKGLSFIFHKKFAFRINLNIIKISLGWFYLEISMRINKREDHYGRSIFCWEYIYIWCTLRLFVYSSYFDIGEDEFF